MISSLTSSSSSSSAGVRVEKATSEFLIGPDWTMNIDICDTINSNHWLAKDVVKAVKKRLQHKNHKVQLLALTLLETMVKNCGDDVHFQIAERNILQDMVRIVKKKTDMHVRDKVLVLLDSWQEAFGGRGGKHSQYYWAYEELRRAGIQFPKRSSNTAPIFTPPGTHPTPRHPQPGYGMPSSSSTRLDEAMAAEVENLSFSSINSMRDVLDLLADMLQAVNPSDRLAVKDEVIVDLVDRCRSNQKKLMQMLTTTGDEELLAQGLELNDSLQAVLAKHDAIASGSVIPTQGTNTNPPSREMHDPTRPKTAEAKAHSTRADAKPSAPALATTQDQNDEEEEEEDDFAQLARRHSKTCPPMHTSEAITSTNVSNTMGLPVVGEPLDPVTNNALVLRDPPAPARPSKEQDIIDLLSITLSSSMPPETPQLPASSSNTMYQEPLPTTQGNPYASQAYLGGQFQSFNSYVAPWAHPQLQPTLQTQLQAQPQHQPQPLPQSSLQLRPQPLSQQPPQSRLQPQHPMHQLPQSALQPQLNQQPNAQFSAQPQPQPQQDSQIDHQLQPHAQTRFPQYSAYPPPPWAATPGYYTNPNPSARQSYMHSIPQATTNTPMSLQGPRPVQQVNSLSARGNNSSNSTAGEKTFIPSYRLFEDLNVFGNGDQRFNSSTGLSGTNNQSMVGGRK